VKSLDYGIESLNASIDKNPRKNITTGWP